MEIFNLPPWHRLDLLLCERAAMEIFNLPPWHRLLEIFTLPYRSHRSTG